MRTIHMLDWPIKRYYGETHVFHRWKAQLAEKGLAVKLLYDHRDPRLRDANCLIIHSRYFSAWQHLPSRTSENEDELLSFLTECKRNVDKLIWFDAADSTGSADFILLPYVDTFLKKQLLRDKTYYLGSGGTSNLRIWLPGNEHTDNPGFRPCKRSELAKLKLAWNLGLNDYRYYGYKLSRLSNYLGYGIYPLQYTAVKKIRPLNMIFRGRIHRDDASQKGVSAQRNKIIRLLNDIAALPEDSDLLSRKAYLNELNNAKIGLSPFGWGEICYRDFEIFIAGSLLMKPDIEHLDTFPQIFVKDKTYISLRWDLNDLEERLNTVLANYDDYLDIAINGQENYQRVSNDHESFISHLEESVS